MTSTFQSQLIETAKMFVLLSSELIALFLGISFFVAVLNQKLPPERIQHVLGAKQGRGYITAAALGAITPFCSCSTIPMLIGLLKARAGFGPVMTFLFTSPLLNPIVIAVFVPILGWQATVLYAGLALVFSISAGVLLGRFRFDRFLRQDMLQTKEQSSCGSDGGTCGTAPSQRATISWSAAWDECWSLFKSMFPYMLIAMLIGAVVHGFVPHDMFATYAGPDNPAAIPVAAVIGIPLYIRVSTLLPL
ncbi:MAG: permease, partial [Halocynthiibacter sp.]